MLYTGLGSGYNLGKMPTLATYLLNFVSWRTEAIIGLGLQFFLILLFPWMLRKVENG